MWRVFGLTALFTLAQGASELSLAACSRLIETPLAAVGLSVTVDGRLPGGVYPELLRGIAKEGCDFAFSVVPRARQEAMFEAGKADLLIPASRSSRRDQFGLFVPLIFARATLISLRSERPAISSLDELLARKDLRVALVRGFDYGDAYRSLVTELREQRRLSLEVDALAVARSLSSGMSDLTIMAPSILVGAISAEPRYQGLLERLRYEPVEELPWSDSGAYLSRTSLSESDREALRELLERSARTGAVWKAFQRNYPAGSLNGSIRPR